MADVENKVAGLAETSLPEARRELLHASCGRAGNTVVQKTRILVVARSGNERSHVAAQVERCGNSAGELAEGSASGSHGSSSKQTRLAHPERAVLPVSSRGCGMSANVYGYQLVAAWACRPGFGW